MVCRCGIWLITHFIRDKYSFHNIDAHDNTITLTQLNGQNDVCSDVVVDAIELIDKKLKTAKLWRRNFAFPPGADQCGIQH